MRSKDEILKDSTKAMGNTPAWDNTASLHERLTIEVLIDIRDILVTDVKDAMNALIELQKASL